jgi:hypothetical protein
MTQPRFFQVSMLAPVALWGLITLVVSLFLRQDYEVRQNLYNGYHIVVPYLIFTLVIWKWVSNKTFGFLMLMAFIVPILWGFFFTLWYLLVSYIQKGSMEPWFVLLIMVFWATLVAYLFEAIPLFILRTFKEDFKTAQQR